MATPPRPLARDPWAVVALLGVVPLLVRAWGAPLGEPVAEDFDFLHHALFGRFSLFDGGGSTAFWRPIPHQIYYRAFSGLMLTHPAVIAGMHVVLLALASLLFYRAFRTVRPGPWAALVATAPLLSESARTMIAWPSDFVNLGLWFFLALATHEISRRRLPSALLAMLGALLCKEVAAIAAALLPLMPGVLPDEERARTRWIASFWVLTALWAGVYLAVRAHAHLAMPHHLEQGLVTASWPGRIGWALANSLRAIVSLPLVEGDTDRAVGALLALVAFLWIAFALRGSRGSARWRAALPWSLWGAAWFVGGSLAITTLYPFWMPARSHFGALGLMALAAELAWAANPYMLGAIAAMRLVALMIAPGAPAHIASAPPATGAFMDFQKLARLQWLMRDTRRTLATRIPGARHGMRIGDHYMPRNAEYAFGGHNALRVWYRDSTLDWVPLARYRDRPDSSLQAIVEFEPESDAHPQVAIVEPSAMRAYLAGHTAVQAGALDRADTLLARADALQMDDRAHVFRGLVAADRALVLLVRGRLPEAESEAERSVGLLRTNVTARVVLGSVKWARGDLMGAAADVDSAKKWDPTNPGVIELERRLLAAAARRR